MHKKKYICLTCISEGFAKHYDFMCYICTNNHKIINKEHIMKELPDPNNELHCIYYRS